MAGIPRNGPWPSFDQLSWRPVVPGAREKALVAGDRRIRLLELDQGFTEQGWCHNEHFGIVLEGRVHVELPGGEILLETGDPITLPSDAKHRHKATVPEDGHVLLFLVEPAP